MLYTGVVLAFLAYHAAAFLILLGHWVVASGMFPKATSAFAAEYERRPIRAALIGIVTWGPLLLLLLQNAKIPNAFVRGVIIAASVMALLIAFIGSTGLALRIGRNLCVGADPWRQILRGGVMLALVFITPVLGWFVVLPIGLASGFGAFLLARPWKARTAPLPAEAPTPAPSPGAVTAPETAVPSLS